MGWVDDALNQLEQWFPDLKDPIETLRQGWDFVTGYYPDPAVLRTQRDTLSELHDRGQQLLSQYTESILSLQQSWQGNLANFYLPPSVTAFQVEHDMEPPDHSVSTRLSNNLLSLVQAFDHNSGTHGHWANQFDSIRGKQTDARVSIVACVGGVAVTSFIPVAGEAGDAAEITATSITIGSILNDVAQLLKDARVVIVIVGAIGITATVAAVDQLVLPHILHSSTTSSGSAGSGSTALTDEDIQLIAEEYGVPVEVVQQWAQMGLTFAEAELAAQLYQAGLTSAYDAARLARWALANGITLAQVLELTLIWTQLCSIAGLSDVLINAFEQNGGVPWGDLGNGNSLLGKIQKLVTAAQNGTGGAQRVLGVLNQLGLGPDGLSGLEDLGQDFTAAGTGSSDADIVLDGQVIEVGGPSPFKSPADLRNQLLKYLKQFGNKVRVWLEDDGSKDAQALIDAAKDTVGGDNVNTFPPSAKKTCT